MRKSVDPVERVMGHQSTTALATVVREHQQSLSQGFPCFGTLEWRFNISVYLYYTFQSTQEFLSFTGGYDFG
ncbi:MAG TPA: hypothetical protein VKY85_15650 [Candidatus Angelobacter sp.]|nr:hypothetical protein [Candidatus Angelobacter sp.]